MTREEHYLKPSKVKSNKGVYYHNKAVNECFDDFESRRCEDCKLFGYTCHLYMRVYQLGWEDNFSCSKWEAKN